MHEGFNRVIIGLLMSIQEQDMLLWLLSSFTFQVSNIASSFYSKQATAVKLYIVFLLLWCADRLSVWAGWYVEECLMYRYMTHYSVFFVACFM